MLFEFYCDGVLVGYVRYSHLINIFDAGRYNSAGESKIETGIRCRWKETFQSFDSLDAALKWARWW
jgi:hypothetical protein